MNRFLSLFPQFRTLRRRLKVALRRVGVLERDNLALLAQSEADQRKITDLMDRLDAARVSEIETTKKATDYFARRYGRPMFCYAPEVPDRDFENQKPIEKSRQQASVIQQEAESQFFRDVAELERRNMEAAAAVQAARAN